MKILKLDFSKHQKLTGMERVDLRDVWEAVDSKQQFADWVADYLLDPESKFKENDDFGLIHKLMKKSRGRPRKDYWITVTAAKKLAMMQKNDVGEQVRDYFLECEKLVYDNDLQGQLSNIPDFTNPNVVLAWAQSYKQACDERDEARAEVVELKVVVDNSKISADAITALTKAIHEQAVSIHPQLGWEGKTKYQVAAVIMRLVKARYTGALAGNTFKELPVKDFDACLAFVKSIDAELINLGQLYKNNDANLKALQAHLQTKLGN